MKEVKISIVFFLLAFASYSGLSQKDQKHVKTTFGDRSIEVTVHEDISTSFSRGNEILFVHCSWRNGGNIAIKKFNIENLTKTVTNYHPGFGNTAAYERILEINNHIYLFYSIYDESAMLYIQEIDFDKGCLTGTPKLVFQEGERIYGKKRRLPLSTNSSGSLNDMRYNNSKEYYSSPEHAKNRFSVSYFTESNNILIWYDLKNNEKIIKPEKGIYNGLVVLDFNLEKLWARKIQLKDITSIKNIFLGKDQSLYLLAKRSSLNKTVAKQTSEIIKITNNSIIRNEMKDPPQHVRSMIISETDSNTFHCVGYYSSSNYDTTGVITYNFNDKLEFGPTKLLPFADSIVNYYKGKQKNKVSYSKYKTDRPEISFIKTRTLLRTDDNNLLLVGRISRNLQYSTDIIVTQLSSDGKIRWTKRLPNNMKYHYVNGNLHFTETDSNYYFFLVEHYKSANFDLYTRPYKFDSYGKFIANGGKGNIACYILNKRTGKVHKEIVTDIKNCYSPDNYNKGVDDIINCDNNQLILIGLNTSYSKQKRGTYLIRMKIDE